MSGSNTMTQDEVRGVIDAMRNLLERDTVNARFLADQEEEFRTKAMDRIRSINANVDAMFGENGDGWLTRHRVPLGSGEHGTREYRFKFQFPTKPFEGDRDSLMQAVDPQQGSIVSGMMENLTGMLNPRLSIELGRGEHLVGIGPDVRLRLAEDRSTCIVGPDGTVRTMSVMFPMELELTLIVGLAETAELQAA